MEEVDLKDLFLYFLKRISVIIAITFAFLLFGLIYTFVIKTPMYKGDTTLILVSKDADNTKTAVTQSDIVLNQKLVSTYSVIVKSKKVLNQVIQNLKLPYTYSELYNHITVSNESDTEIIRISVSNKDPELSAQIANTVASVFKDEVIEIYNLENVSIIDKAEVQQNPYNINTVKTVGICFVGGFAISIMILFVFYYFDNSIKSSEDVEKKLGVAVIGTIPQIRKKGKK